MRHPRPIYAALASLIQAAQNCQQSNNAEWLARHKANAEQIVKDFLPSGSGWDCGTKLDWDASTAERIVFRGSFHHMDENGFYCGWTYHTVTVRPSLQNGFNLSISGRDRNEIKEVLHSEFDYMLRLIVAQQDSEPFRYIEVKAAQ
jgi:hypothetical protein